MSANESAGGAGAGATGSGAAGSGAAAVDSAAGPGAALAGAAAAASGGGAATGTKKRMNLTLTDKTAAVHDLLARSDNGVLRRGAAGEVGEKYGNTGRAMLNLWKRYQQQKAAGVVVPDVSCRRRGNNKRDISQQKEALQSIPLKLRTTQRSVAESIDLPKTTFRRRMKNLGVKSHSRFLKPALTNACKLDRLRWARSFVSTSAGELVNSRRWGTWIMSTRSGGTFAKKSRGTTCSICCVASPQIWRYLVLVLP